MVGGRERTLLRGGLPSGWARPSELACRQAFGLQACQRKSDSRAAPSSHVRQADEADTSAEQNMRGWLRNATCALGCQPQKADLFNLEALSGLDQRELERQGSVHRDVP